MNEKFYYSAKFINCTQEERDYFKAKSCIISISVGQPAHEEKKLEATLNLVNQYFKIAQLQ